MTELEYVLEKTRTKYYVETKDSADKLSKTEIKEVELESKANLLDSRILKLEGL